MCGFNLDVVNKYKYLGYILNFDLCEYDDIERTIKSFNRSFGSFNRKFYSVDFNVKYSIFNSLCLSFYGMNLWTNNDRCKGIFKQLAVSYHFALKKMLNLPKYFSNHYVCSILNVLTMENFMNFRILNFYFWLRDCFSECFFIHRSYFLKFSHFKTYVENIFLLKYNIPDVLDNDIEAILARIFLIQSREPSSWFLGL